MQDFKHYLDNSQELGFVEEIRPPITRISGLPGASVDEIVMFETGGYGLVLDLLDGAVDVLKIVGQDSPIGTKVVRTNSSMSIPVSSDMIGSMVDPLGNVLERILPSQAAGDAPVLRDIHSKVLTIEQRSQITKSFSTGVSVVDMMLPIGKGQRELVLGDRKIGKTEFLLQVLLEQSNKDSVCVYSCVGKRKSDIFRVLNFVKTNNIKNVIIVKSLSNDNLGTIFITPYASMAICEYFRDLGKDVVLILDDLSTHAKFYRELSLVSEKFPGRSSYPGDIFYKHARLLERAGNFAINQKEVSITCFPVAESPAGDITGYISTNLMSITDGHLFFDNDLFEKGRRPSINYFLSVTRVGRQTQSKLLWSINREITSFLTLLSKSEDFLHFGAEINEGIKSTMEMGQKIESFLNQNLGTVRSLHAQVLTFCLIWSGLYNQEAHGEVAVFADRVSDLYLSNELFNELVDKLIHASEDLNSLLSQVGANAKEVLKYVE